MRLCDYGVDSCTCRKFGALAEFTLRSRNQALKWLSASELSRQINDLERQLADARVELSTRITVFGFEIVGGDREG